MFFARRLNFSATSAITTSHPFHSKQSDDQHFSLDWVKKETIIATNKEALAAGNWSSTATAESLIRYHPKIKGGYNRRSSVIN
jgi:hypothetical protein